MLKKHEIICNKRRYTIITYTATRENIKYCPNCGKEIEKNKTKTKRMTYDK